MPAPPARTGPSGTHRPELLPPCLSLPPCTASSPSPYPPPAQPHSPSPSPPAQHCLTYLSPRPTPLPFPLPCPALPVQAPFSPASHPLPTLQAPRSSVPPSMQRLMQQHSRHQPPTRSFSAANASSVAWSHAASAASAAAAAANAAAATGDAENGLLRRGSRDMAGISEEHGHDELRDEHHQSMWAASQLSTASATSPSE